MKKTWILAACMGFFLFAGCGGEKQDVYEQAGQDLEQANYEYAISGYEASVANEYKIAEAYRGMGIAKFRMGNYEEAITDFTNALNCEKVGEVLEQDVLMYRGLAYLKSGLLSDAMADCQTLAEQHSMNKDSYFLTGKVALAMDSYDEASGNFEHAYAEDPTYDTAIQIYEAYVQRDMEADGTRYLEAALQTEPEDAEDYCARGRVYYYMEDYKRAQEELIKASNEGSTEALLLLGTVYLAQKDISNARSMYQEYITAVPDSAKGYNGLALCDMEEENYASALVNISNGLPNASTEEMQNLMFNEIVVYERQLDFATAQQKAEKYLEYFPDDETVKRELTFIKTRTGSN